MAKSCTKKSCAFNKRSLISQDNFYKPNLNYSVSEENVPEGILLKTAKASCTFPTFIAERPSEIQIHRGARHIMPHFKMPHRLAELAVFCRGTFHLVVKINVYSRAAKLGLILMLSCKAFSWFQQQHNSSKWAKSKNGPLGNKRPFFFILQASKGLEVLVNVFGFTVK